MQQKSRDRVAPESTWPELKDAFGLPITPVEYMIAIVPHEDLCERIKALRQEFATRFEHPAAANGAPRLVLVRFRQYEMKELFLRNRLRTIINGLAAYRVELEDFGSYPTHTIFFRVTTQEPLKAISRQLRQAQSLMTINRENKPNFIQEPHIPLASRLLPWQYEKGWLHYSNTHFSASCIADQVVLLRRKTPNTAWQLLERFRMMDITVETKQGDLFG